MTTEEFVDWINKFPIAQPNPIPGAQGPQGPQGVPGLDGLLGLDGPQGVQGIQGLPGLSGPQGRVGATGGRGYQGLRGLQGNTGSQGFQGVAGTAGPQGFQGSSSSQQLPFKFVSSLLELQRALEKGGRIIFSTRFPVNEPLVIPVNYTSLEGLTKECGIIGNYAKNGGYKDIFDIRAANVSIQNLTIDSGHTLGEHLDTLTVAIRLSSQDGLDTSGLQIKNNHFLNTRCGIWRYPGSSNAVVLENLIIEDNEFFGFSHTAILLNWKLLDPILNRNRIFGRYKNQTHAVEGNAIWVGNYADTPIITENRIYNTDRIPIEYWNSQENPANIDGNKFSIISKNIIKNTKGFAISAFGAGVTVITENIIDGCVIGIEAYNDKTNHSEFLVANNYINKFTSQAISINGVENGSFVNNIIGEGSSTHAIQIINGGKDLKIEGNKFTNAGRYSILINGIRMNIVGISKATDAVFTCTNDILTSGFHVGKKIFIREVLGMTQVNGRYYTITKINGKTFQVGLNTSTFNDYISGGVVQERYRDISILNNKFTNTKYVGGFTEGRAFYGYDYQSVILKNNESHYNPNIANLGGFLALNLANTYIDDSPNPVRTSGISNLTGSNLVIPFIE